MKERICAVVVTYNRKTLLRTGLCALLRQTRQLDQILVVDNGSTDGTKEMLEAEFRDCQVLRTPENLGGAGGFRAGMEWAHQAGFDWTWVMDDDIEPFPDTLEFMLSYKGISDFIHVGKQSASGTFNWEG